MKKLKKLWEEQMPVEDTPPPPPPPPPTGDEDE